MMSTCTRCGASFSCGMQDAASDTCWCMRLPQTAALPSTGTDAACWRPACLEQHIAQSGATPPATPPHRLV